LVVPVAILHRALMAEAINCSMPVTERMGRIAYPKMLRVEQRKRTAALMVQLNQA
jgi:hypothetical protein